MTPHLLFYSRPIKRLKKGRGRNHSAIIIMRVAAAISRDRRRPVHSLIRSTTGLPLAVVHTPRAIRAHREPRHTTIVEEMLTRARPMRLRLIHSSQTDRTLHDRNMIHTHSCLYMKFNKAHKKKNQSNIRQTVTLKDKPHTQSCTSRLPGGHARGCSLPDGDGKPWQV